jgi:hypothetical protein
VGQRERETERERSSTTSTSTSLNRHEKASEDDGPHPRHCSQQVYNGQRVGSMDRDRQTIDQSMEQRNRAINTTNTTDTDGERMMTRRR